MLVEPLALAAEAAHLERVGVPGALDLLSVDRDALLTTPYHRAANQARERARPDEQRHGSCGMGIGETARYALEFPGDAPRAGDCDATRMLARKLGLLRDRLVADVAALATDGSDFDRTVPPVADLCDAYRAFASRVRLTGGDYLTWLLHAGPVVFEGAQGILLDEWHGFHPYTTWSTTTFANAQALLDEAGASAVRLGVTRTYMTRHGPGPLVTEDPTLELPDRHNVRNRWQGEFRVGHFDAVALGYAVEVAGGVDGIALTHLDTAARSPLRLCQSYQVGGQRLTRLAPGPEHDLQYQERLTRMLLRARPVYEDPGQDWPGVIEEALGAPVAIRCRGPARADIRVTGITLQSAW